MSGVCSMDLFAYAQTVRDAEMSRVYDNAQPWGDRAFAAFQSLTLPDEFTAEAIRYGITARVGAPHHSNAWGAFIMRLSRAKLIVKTGRWVNGTDPRSHAAALPVYRRGW